MYVELTSNPVSLIVFAAFLLYCLYFFQLWRKLKIFVFGLPLVLLLLLFKPVFYLNSLSESKFTGIMVDFSHSSSLVAAGEKLQLIRQLQKKYSISTDELYDQGGRRLDIDIFTNNQWKKLVHGRYTASLGRENMIVLTDETQPAQPHSVRLQLPADLTGIYDTTVPPVCYRRQRCEVSTRVISRQGDSLVLRLDGRVIEKKNIAPGFAGEIKFMVSLPANSPLGNRKGTLQLYGTGQEVDFLLSIQKGLPSGLFRTENTNLLSWRLATSISEFPFWRVSRNQRSQVDFEIILGPYNGQSFNRPALFIWPNGNAANLKGFKKERENLFRKKRVYVFAWPLPSLRDNVFVQNAGMKEALEVFAQKIRSSQAGLVASSLEVGKPLYLTEISDTSLTYSGKKITTSRDIQSGAYFFLLPALGSYKYGNLEFRANVQAEELSSIFLLHKNRQQVNVEEEVAALQEQLQGEKFERLGFEFGLGPENGLAGQLVVLLILLCLLTLFWYFPIYRDSR